MCEPCVHRDGRAARLIACRCRPIGRLHFENRSISVPTYICFPPSRNVMCRNVSILCFAKTYVKILRNVKYFYVLPKRYVNFDVTFLRLLRLHISPYVLHGTLRYVTDRHVRINGTLRFLTLRYLTWGWKTGISSFIVTIHGLLVLHGISAMHSVECVYVSALTTHFSSVAQLIQLCDECSL